VAIRSNPHHGAREAAVLTWGLVPPWADDPSIAYRMINARRETAAQKPAFRHAMRRRRCLIPADGFYEWRRNGSGPKQPYYFRAPGGERLLAFAGLWEHWDSPDGSEIESCCLLTTEANELMAPIHNRMPVLIAPRDYARWLDPANEKPHTLQELFAPPPTDTLEHWPVSPAVNFAENDSPELLTPTTAHPGAGQQELF